jgi:hypothetical protein
MRTVAPPAPDPLLPTRTASRGPDGGVDRLASFGAGGPGERSVTATSSPSALQAALAAFDSRRNGEAETLPSRPRTDDFGAPDDPTSVSQSRLDPDALRERLRAFQTEFRTGTAGATDTNHTSSQADLPNADLGGDRR